MDTSGFRNPLPPAGRWKGRSGCSIKGQRQPVVARQGTSCNGKRGGFGGEKCLCHRLEMLSLEEREKRAQVLMVMEPSDHGSLSQLGGWGTGEAGVCRGGSSQALQGDRVGGSWGSVFARLVSALCTRGHCGSGGGARIRTAFLSSGPAPASVPLSQQEDPDGGVVALTAQGLCAGGPCGPCSWGCQ